MDKFIRIALSAYITNQDDADSWERVKAHYGEPERSASSLIIQLIREKSLAILDGQTKRQQLRRLEDGNGRIEEKVERLEVDVAEIRRLIAEFDVKFELIADLRVKM